MRGGTAVATNQGAQFCFFLKKEEFYPHKKSVCVGGKQYLEELCLFKVENQLHSLVAKLA